ncbi:MAG: hypothetical protein JWP89_4454 [Schlesneria sp.]|nr:hypothetical protein [Schlesneria sp.]
MTLQDLRIQRWAWLAAAIIAIGTVWLVLLPFIGGQQDVAAHIANQQRLGIDPSAMFYTELEVAPVLTDHVELLRETFPDRFWK